ncbi:hypothetical protein Csa_014485 [Cucumis sativus]|nr:hypothetical protein Csa_014485 [Cucumis sativus]
MASPRESNRAPEDESHAASRRIERLSLHLTPMIPLPGDDSYRMEIVTCAGNSKVGRMDVDMESLSVFMRGKHREIQERVFDYFNSRPELQTPVEISMNDHRELCMKQLIGLVREAGIKPFSLFVNEDPGKYFAIMEAVGSVDVSLAIKMGVQFRKILLTKTFAHHEFNWNFSSKLLSSSSLDLWGGSVLNLGTKKHRDKFFDGIDNVDYPGCFAMTELHHGSNVQGLQTTATFDLITDEFIINTPNDGAIKWWIGNAAVHGKFATVFAKLVLPTHGSKKTADMGVHAFIVPIRDLKTHKTLPGIEIHDCGHKVGLNGVDNGALRFRSVRIPRDNLLDRFGQVSRDGKYKSSLPSINKRFAATLGELVGGRVALAYSSASVLKIASTIAIRYSLLRQQFGPPKQAEVSILDYQSQQHKLMPMLASTYAFQFATIQLVEKYTQMKKTHDEELVGDVHALSAGLKAYITSYTAKSLSTCREACGGHGYAAVAAYLLKQYKEKFQGGTLALTWNYLRESMNTYLSQPNPVTARWESADHLRDPKFQLDAFQVYIEHLALLQSVAVRLRKHTKTLGGFGAWNRCLNHLLTLRRISYRATLKLVCDLYALDRIWNDIGTYRNVDYVAPNKAKAIHKLTEYLCFQVRNVAQELVDAFDLPDHVTRAPIAMQSNAYSQYTQYVGF